MGLDRVGATTYTKAAGDELRVRLAASLGMTEASPAILRRRLPWVGTIHSLCFRLLGLGAEQVVSTKRLQEFCQDRMLTSPSTERWSAAEPETPFLDEPSVQASEMEWVRWVGSAAAHREVTLDEAYDLLPEEAQLQIPIDRLIYLHEDYTAWKRKWDLYDYDDMLLRVLEYELCPPLKVLFCDEVQDNTPLLWRVVDSWQRSLSMLVCVGDPYQAIYIFNGARPDLFRSRPGRWFLVGNSHRFDQSSADYARRVLWRVGIDDPLLASWQGVGGEARDGIIYHLARTNYLVSKIAGSLQSAGEPYGLLRGRAPLQTRAAEAYRLLVRLSRDECTTGLGLIADALPRGVLTQSARARAKRFEGPADTEAAERVFDQSIGGLLHALPSSEYFERVLATHGLRGLFLRPTYLLGTAHSAKGKEADHVIVERCWSWKPARHIANGGAQDEALLAYVAASRHRVSLTLSDEVSGEGIDYDFPARRQDDY